MLLFSFIWSNSLKGENESLKMGLGVQRWEGFEPVPKCMSEDTEERADK